MDLNVFAATGKPLESATEVVNYVKENTQEAIKEGFEVEDMGTATVLQVATLDALLAIVDKLSKIEELLSK